LHEPTLKPKIAKEYVLLTLKEMLTKFKEIKGMKKAQQLTKHIHNGWQSAINKVIINKLTDIIKINRSAENTATVYMRDRYMSGRFIKS